MGGKTKSPLCFVPGAGVMAVADAGALSAAANLLGCSKCVC